MYMIIEYHVPLYDIMHEIIYDMIAWIMHAQWAFTPREGQIAQDWNIVSSSMMGNYEGSG